MSFWKSDGLVGNLSCFSLAIEFLHPHAKVTWNITLLTECILEFCMGDADRGSAMKMGFLWLALENGC